MVTGSRVERALYSCGEICTFISRCLIQRCSHYTPLLCTAPVISQLNGRGHFEQGTFLYRLVAGARGLHRDEVTLLFRALYGLWSAFKTRFLPVSMPERGVTRGHSLLSLAMKYRREVRRVLLDRNICSWVLTPTLDSRMQLGSLQVGWEAGVLSCGLYPHHLAFRGALAVNILQLGHIDIHRRTCFPMNLSNSCLRKPYKLASFIAFFYTAFLQLCARWVKICNAEYTYRRKKTRMKRPFLACGAPEIRNSLSKRTGQQQALVLCGYRKLNFFFLSSCFPLLNCFRILMLF